MKNKILRKNCLRCVKNFLTYEEDKVYCNSDCESKAVYEKHFGCVKTFKDSVCECCGLRVKGSTKYCSKDCDNSIRRQKLAEKRELINKEENILGKSNLKKVSYTELNRRLEYKRLYDDFYIRRQLEGKTRDLI